MAAQTSQNYSSWGWDYRNLPLGDSFAEKARFFIQAGTLAPTIHNTQPWQFSIDEDGHTVTISPDWDYYLPISDPTTSALYISLGCAITNMEVAAATHGFRADIAESSGSFVLRFSKATPDLGLKPLAVFLTQRYSNKLPYLKKPIPESSLEQLSSLTTDAASSLLSTNPQLIQKVAAIHADATLAGGKVSGFARELTNWLRPNGTRKPDGMPGFVVGLKPTQSVLLRLVLRYLPNPFRVLAAKDKVVLLGSPAVGLVTSERNSVSSWVSAGRLYERMALKARSLGLECTPLYAMLMDSASLKKLTKLFGLVKQTPQFFFRLGFADNLPYHTPRRMVDSFLRPQLAEAALLKTLTSSPVLHRFRIRSFDINYLKAGSGPDLVLVHGGNIGWGQWYPNIDALAAHYTVYALDLPGGGRSTRVNFRTVDPVTDMAGILEEFIQKLQLNRPRLVGSSNGAWVVASIALKMGSSVGKIVLVDALGLSRYIRPADKVLGFYPLAIALSKTIMRPMRSNPDLEKLLRSVFFNPKLDLRTEFIDYFYETMATSHNVLFISRLTRLITSGKLSLVKKLSRLHNPTLVVWGREDHLMPLHINEKYFSLIPHRRVKILDKAGHIPSIEKSKEFNEAVIAFLR